MYKLEREREQTSVDLISLDSRAIVEKHLRSSGYVKSQSKISFVMMSSPIPTNEEHATWKPPTVALDISKCSLIVFGT